MEEVRVLASLMAWIILGVVVLLQGVVLTRKRSITYHQALTTLSAFLLVVMAGALSALVFNHGVLGDSGQAIARGGIIFARAVATALLLGVLFDITHRPSWLLRIFGGGR